MSSPDIRPLRGRRAPARGLDAEKLKRRGAAIVHLPPYNPDFNPIEMAFAKLKALLRKLAARTLARLWNSLGDLLVRFTPQEGANYLASAGYVPANRDPL